MRRKPADDVTPLGLKDHTVCPRCSRPYENGHAAGCPDEPLEPFPAAYEAGWDAARQAFNDAARWAQEEERKRTVRALHTYADYLANPDRMRLPSSDPRLP